MIKRSIEENITSHFFKGKVILLFGARQVGKTTLMNFIIEKTQHKVLYLNGDEADIRQQLSNTTSTFSRQLFI